MKLLKNKYFKLLMAVILLFNFTFQNTVFAAEPSSNEEVTILVNNDKESQIEVERDGIKATLEFNKETNEISLSTNEKSKVTGENKKDYIVNADAVTKEKIEATFIDVETGEDYYMNSDEFRASVAWLVPLGVILGEILLSHLAAAGLAVIISGITYTAVKEVASKLKKKDYNHYMAILTKGDLYIGNALTKEQAVERLKSSDDKNNNVWSVNYFWASVIAREAGNDTKPVGPERDYGKTSADGYYMHFHLYNRSGGHSFYY